MFTYTDPVGRSFLGMSDVENEYRRIMGAEYNTHARLKNSGFTWIEAFQSLEAGQLPQIVSVSWESFPLTAQVTEKQIDSDRFSHQDEYVEWRAEVKGGKLVQVTFTTEFPEYYEAFAAVSEAALVSAIRDVIPDSEPTTAELFGPGFNPAASTPIARAKSFRARLRQNPWNNGQKGILCLTQQFNTLGALFNLLSACGIPNPQGTPQDTCALVGGACGPGRSSDPNVCAVAQQAVRDKVGFTLRDPAGVRIVALKGAWRVKNNAIDDVNELTSNQGVWQVSRNGRRAVLNILSGLTLDGEIITTGAQVARKLSVVADLLAAPNNALPDWARIGVESNSRGPTE